MGRRKRLNVVRKSSKSQAKEELIGSSNDVNQKNHRINEECAQFEGIIHFLAQFLFAFVLKLHLFIMNYLWHSQQRMQWYQVLITKVPWGSAKG